MTSEQNKLSGIFTTWMGMPVYLNVTTGTIKTSLFCTIIGESDATVRVRNGGQWDVDIYKEMIQVVDAFPYSHMILADENSETSANTIPSTR